MRRGGDSQTNVAPITAPFQDELLREWENGRMDFSKEQDWAVICLPDISPPPPHPPYPPSEWNRGKLFCLSCGKFVQIKPFKADVCYLYSRRTGLTLGCRLISFLFFPESVFSNRRVPEQIVVTWQEIYSSVSRHFHLVSVRLNQRHCKDTWKGGGGVVDMELVAFHS